MTSNNREKRASQAFEDAKNLSYHVRDSHDPDDMLAASKAWKQFAMLTNDPTEKSEGHLHARRYKKLSRPSTLSCAFLRGLRAGQVMKQLLGPHLSSRGRVDETSLEEAFKALAPTNNTVAAPPVPMALVKAFWRGYNQGLKLPKTKKELP
jgi:hypothetical protein